MSATDSGSGAFKGTRRNVRRARWRMGLFEIVILVLAMSAAVVGGAILAAILNATIGAPFRFTWFMTALLLFVVPAAAQLVRAARSRPSEQTDTEPAREEH